MPIFKILLLLVLKIYFYRGTGSSPLDFSISLFIASFTSSITYILLVLVPFSAFLTSFLGIILLVVVHSSLLLVTESFLVSFHFVWAPDTLFSIFLFSSPTCLDILYFFNTLVFCVPSFPSHNLLTFVTKHTLPLLDHLMIVTFHMDL